MWLLALSLWIFSTKLIKVAPYFTEYPRDLVLLPGYILFGYFHSLIKVYALLTVWNISWSGRKLDVEAGFGAELTCHELKDDELNSHFSSQPQGGSLISSHAASVTELRRLWTCFKRAAWPSGLSNRSGLQGQSPRQTSLIW